MTRGAFFGGEKGGGSNRGGGPPLEGGRGNEVEEAKEERKGGEKRKKELRNVSQTQINKYSPAFVHRNTREEASPMSSGAGGSGGVGGIKTRRRGGGKRTKSLLRNILLLLFAAAIAILSEVEEATVNLPWYANIGIAKKDFVFSQNQNLGACSNSIAPPLSLLPGASACQKDVIRVKNLRSNGKYVAP